MPRKKNKPDPTRPGSLVWTKRGRQQKALGVIVRPGAGGFVFARVFNELNRRWNPPHLIGVQCVVGFANATDYDVRRALSFADVELTDILLGVPKA